MCSASSILLFKIFKPYILADILEAIAAVEGSLPGETADSAIMFLPSESIYSEINIRFPKLVNESRNKKVYMAGPDNLMLLLHTVRAILRDATMSQTAGKIQIEVDKLGINFTSINFRFFWNWCRYLGNFFSLEDWKRRGWFIWLGGNRNDFFISRYRSKSRYVF